MSEVILHFMYQSPYENTMHLPLIEPSYRDTLSRRTPPH